MNTEIATYKRIGNLSQDLENSRFKSILGLTLTKKSVLIFPLAFLLGRTSLLGGMMPFGTALYASTLGLNVNRVLVALSVILGMVTSGAKEQLYISLAAMFLFNALNIPFKNQKNKMTLRLAVIASISILLPQLLMTYLEGFLLYDFLKAVLHATVIFLLVFIYRNAIPMITDPIMKRSLTSEEITSIAITAALALSGFSDFHILGFTLKNVLCILIVLLFSFKCGSGVGAAIGVTVGLIVSMSAPGAPLLIASYAFCGLLSGIFKNLGKFGSAVGFVMGNALITLYLNGSTEVLIYLKEIIAACLLFMFIPVNLMNSLTEALNVGTDGFTDRRGYGSRIKEITVDKLNKFSRTFKELSKTFNEIAETKMVTDKQDISYLFDRVADKVCKNCSLCLHCWDRNFYSTYQVMFKIVERLDSKGRIEENDIPDYFINRCERINEFVNSVNNIYEVFKVGMVWKSKIGESRELVSQQLEGLSKVISNLASEINIDMHFKEDLENTLLNELIKVGIRASEVVVFENKWGKYEISIFHKGCGGKRACVASIEKLVSNVLGRKMMKDSTDCQHTLKRSSCTLKLVEEEVFKVTTGIARVSKYSGIISGDNYTFMSNGDGKYVLALSDGMGSGQKAAAQSRATISLLEQLMETGFDKDTTVKLINSILVLKSTEETFATIDLSLINLFSGEVEFVKIGAVPTYIKKSDGVEIVKSFSLPAGILSNIETELIKKNVESGDFVIMLTDGILDSFNNETNKEKALTQFIQEIDTLNPQEIADLILNKAYDNCEGKPTDDMMVLVAKVWKRIG
ncbi:MAG: stage II sporulation protein E [Clostridia bacterium]|nr:stage II sporulation protein E [Clostridia bacterium]